jgi:crotonobetainyl-CoA:carnitine CoA-transferase CaiB-like acyl-CoA transferase
MARPELVDDPKLGTDAGRLANRADMIKLIEDWLATFPDRDSAVAHMQQNAVPAAPVLSIEETVSHPHLRARGTVRTIEDRFAGKFEIPGMPLRFSACRSKLRPSVSITVRGCAICWAAATRKLRSCARPMS